MKKICLLILALLLATGCMTRTERKVGLDGRDKTRTLRRTGFLGLTGDYQPDGEWQSAPKQR